jgi:hypothetical protein
VADGGNQMPNIIKALNKNHMDLKKIKLLGVGLLDNAEFTKIPELQGAWFPSSPAEPYAVFEKRFANTYGYKPVRLAALAYDATAIVAKIAMKGQGVDVATLTNPNGFADTSNGLVRLLPNGRSDRKLVISEVTQQGLKQIDAAPKTFIEQ